MVIIMMIISFNVIDLSSTILINAKFATIVNNYSAYTEKKCLVYFEYFQLYFRFL